MGTGLQEIFHALNCQATSTSGLQRNTNKVGSMIVQMVQDELRCTENSLLYFKHYILIFTEANTDSHHHRIHRSSQWTIPS